MVKVFVIFSVNFSEIQQPTHPTTQPGKYQESQIEQFMLKKGYQSL